MTKKRQKIQGASLFACISLPISYCCKTSLTIDRQPFISSYDFLSHTTIEGEGGSGGEGESDGVDAWGGCG